MNWHASYTRQLLSGRFREIKSNGHVKPTHFLLAIANHFEPGWQNVPLAVGINRVTSWIETTDKIRNIKDQYGSGLKHSYFFPLEQYEKAYIETLARHCREGFGEIEVHLHHGIESPDTAENLKSRLIEYISKLRKEHGWEVNDAKGRGPCYVFVHGNWALANSAGGMYCGVDNELAILRETGCYADLTMPSAPDRTQVPVINSIYTPSLPLDSRAAHGQGEPLSVGCILEDPVFFLIDGPLLFNWRRKKLGIPVPRIENGELSADYLPTLQRFRLWASARVHVIGRPEWIFIKLHCHGLQERNMAGLAGETMGRFAKELLAFVNSSGSFLHFVSAREMANIALAAVNGAEGDPDDYRNYNWKLANSVDQ
jgi:hypothetical protein